ncbi:conserved hypothetical protein [Theileria orientalis strain Shintoku]|uniref:Abscisic acid G-protein coupled receptor-like domain-containing protein n=1 Tax=Theileria orientalis strain Shintoku TaxID=869250 RepID=J4C977_THEOR|nr:conserved hypothetical protein [Theileria orientalis strain Shintoku]PVC51411.1 hypothetical protein MACL_00001568 [Theileria orientalis]BAM42058.1 conserved hypothetical protein [Theileria orientalis strain Shintoku]|eukprot:XP_009692359.1 conserved hypothetical protein [Theileria orientalis strain Shintoku]
MASTLLFKTGIVSLHVFLSVLGCLAIEFILYLRRNHEQGNIFSDFTSSSFVTTIREGGFRSFVPYLLSSWRRFGTLIFGLTCLGSIGFIANLSFLYFINVNENKEFLQSFWKFDAVLCTILLFFVIPLGMSNKFVSLRSNLELKQKLLGTLSFCGVWIGFGIIVGHIVLHAMFYFMKPHSVGVIFTGIYYMCGFGLFFVALLVGFSGIYFPYLLYIINRDVSSVRQLESLITDCNKARRDLKVKMLENNVYYSDDEALDDEFLMQVDSGSLETTDSSTEYKNAASKAEHLLTSYLPAEMCVNFELDDPGRGASATSKVDALFRKLKTLKLKVSSKLYKLNYAREFHSSGSQHDNDETSVRMWMMMNELKSDLDYLRMLKKEKQSSSKLSGKLFLGLKCLVAGGCMINCYKICKRAILMLVNNYSESLSRIENQKIITKAYYEFMRDEIVSSILNDVLESVQLPTAFDFVISRANSIFLACVMISSVGYFLDFGRVLLKTKYLQKNKLMSDNTLGLALACFMILTFPSQFVLVVPFLPKDLKQQLLAFLFKNDLYVWFGLRYRFDLIVLVTIILTFIGILCLHYSRSFKKLNYHVGCNV